MLKGLLLLAAVFVVLQSSGAAGRNWTLANVNGGDYELSEQAAGQPSLLIFWATWCKPCKAELDNMRSTFDDLRRRGMNVLLVSEDNQKSKSRVKPYLDSKNYGFTGLLDPDGEVLKLYGGTSIPFIVMLDGNGTPVFENRGELKDPSAMLAKANQLLETASD
ncbi:TlpA family protein disulfide reductase [bacterium]|nr:TlpA family protein disulfide reductase [bacterium]